MEPLSLQDLLKENLEAVADLEVISKLYPKAAFEFIGGFREVVCDTLRQEDCDTLHFFVENSTAYLTLCSSVPVPSGFWRVFMPRFSRPVIPVPQLDISLRDIPDAHLGILEVVRKKGIRVY